MMTEARIGRDFVDQKDFIDQVFKIKFPGYGFDPVLKVAAAGREFIVGSIEIPQVAKERYFVLERMAGGALHLIDDFVMAHAKHWESSLIAWVPPAFVPWGQASINVIPERCVLWVEDCAITLQRAWEQHRDDRTRATEVAETEAIAAHTVELLTTRGDATSQGAGAHFRCDPQGSA